MTGCDTARPWVVHATGVSLRVRLTPRADRDAVAGVSERPDGAVLEAHVRAVPQDGEANTALERLLADAIGLSRRDVAVTSGATARIKTVSLSGDPVSLVRRLDALMR